MQVAELSAAERLEQEARLRRERAVAHGADPQILNPGGQQMADMSTGINSGAPNMTGVGVGSNVNGTGTTVPHTQAGMAEPGVGAPLHAAHMQPGMETNVQQQGMNGNYPAQGQTQGLANNSAYPPISHGLVGH